MAETDNKEIPAGLTYDGLDWRTLKSKRQKRKRFKDYQEELLEETPGALSRTNVASHAVVDVKAEASENEGGGMAASTAIRNQALIHYVARLASSNNDNDEFDFSFVQSLLDNGADINASDRYGQTIFHEVARSWNVDVALFLLSKGADINEQDKYGRAPLHVACAVDYTEMLEFLLHNDADIGLTTFGELQAPIHYAAKNDACEALKLLIDHGASIHCRDYQNRTPLQVAASMSRSKAARYLVELGAPTGVYDHNGEMTLSLLILKMPEVATLALDQFRSQDMINRKEYNFLNYIEGPRIYDRDPRENKARSPLEVAIQHEQYGIVMHPIMQRLVNTKWEQFGKKGAQSDLIINLLFAFVWTILGITMPKSADKLYSPLKTTWWRLLLALMTIGLTGLEMFKQISNLIYMNRAMRRWKAFRQTALWNDKRFCHPQWLEENEYLDKEIKIADEERLFSRQDGWIFLDWIALLLIVAGLASHIAFLVNGSPQSRDAHVRIVAFLLIVFWIRLLKFTRPFKEPGPFVASIGPMMRDFVKWSLLFCLLFIPYAAIFWMIFGHENENNEDHDDGSPESPFDIPGLLFTVFTMAAFSNLAPIHDFETIDKDMARLLTSTFVAISTIITLNLLIAMLADTFTRMYEYSLETATMQRAKTILYLEQTLSPKTWRKYCDHIVNECSPEVTSLDEVSLLMKRDKMRLKETLYRRVGEIHAVVTNRFARRIGKDKSDMDRLLESVNMLNHNVMSTMQSAMPKYDEYEGRSPTVLNLNIVLEPAGKNFTSSQQKSGLRRNKKTSTAVVPRCLAAIKEKGGKGKLESNKHTKTYLRNLSISSDLSSHDIAESVEEGNYGIRKQIVGVLDRMKEAVSNGKLNLGFNGRTITEELGVDVVNGDQSPNGEETEISTADDEMCAVSERDWAHYETQPDGNSDEINNDDELRANMNVRTNWYIDEPQTSVHEMSMGTCNAGGTTAKVYSQAVGQPNHVKESPRINAGTRGTIVSTQNQKEASSSTSSESTASYDDSSEGQHTSTAELVKLDEASDTNEDTDCEYREALISKGMADEHGSETDVSQQTSNDSIINLLARSTTSNAEYHNMADHRSDTDTSSHRTSVELVNNGHFSDVIDTDYVSSSLASDVSNQYLGDHHVVASAQATGSQLSSGGSLSREFLARTPHVTWADDVGNSNTPFVHIREITTSPSHSEICSSEDHADDGTSSDGYTQSDV